MQHRFDELHFAIAVQRYEQLIKHQPGLLRRAPAGVPASYIGVTQETLSRIGGKMTEGA